MILEQSILKARNLLLSERTERYWQFPLESDCTMTAEYILLQEFLGEPIEHCDSLVNYILSKQQTDGGWSLFEGGKSDLSCSVKCYFALKILGFDELIESNIIAKDFILKNGGVENSNVFTHILLAIHQQIPWEVIPWTPVELILLPKWFPFTIHKIAYWSRVVMVPLSVIISSRAISPAVRPNIVSISELFVNGQWDRNAKVHTRGFQSFVILKIENFCQQFLSEPISRIYRKRALQETSDWLLERSNGNDGLGGIFPAMAAMLIALPHLKLPFKDKYHIKKSTQLAISKLIVQIDSKTAFVQPCISPVWDTAISIIALNETLKFRPDQNTTGAIQIAARWLSSKQIDIDGDWTEGLKKPEPNSFSGWAFQRNNDFFPDVDDTAMVIKALSAFDNLYFGSIDSGKKWLSLMQSSNGGYGAFDVNNDHAWINSIPFADHGAMLDPPTEDVSGRVLSVMNRYKGSDFSKEKLITYLLKSQTKDGLWWGRWGLNYTWGTWSVVSGLCQVLGRKDVNEALLKTGKALVLMANYDGGFGESNESYTEHKLVLSDSNAFHTALALLTMCDLYENNFDLHPDLYITAKKAAHWLVDHQQEDGNWPQAGSNAPGFPRVFHLTYHGYSLYFPLYALARAEKIFFT